MTTDPLLPPDAGGGGCCQSSSPLDSMPTAALIALGLLFVLRRRRVAAEIAA
jgi:uncharacterized protein (TIGR03382 family)